MILIFIKLGPEVPAEQKVCQKVAVDNSKSLQKQPNWAQNQG